MNSRHHVLFAIRCFHERSIEQVVKTLLHTLFYGTAVFLNLSYDVAHAGSIRILEDSIITYHTTLSNLAVILDMEHGETSGILVKVIHRAVLATHYPVNVHLENTYSGLVCCSM